MITISKLSHSVGPARILSDISVQLPKGKITALIGPNGAGKSTLLSLISRLMPIQSGTIQVDDLIVGHCADKLLAKTLSILPQESAVAPRLTVRELVGFGRYPHHNGRPGHDDLSWVERALEIFTLTDLADRPLDTLSGGQRKRAHVAMTFVQDTGYMLLDEPLNNLDIAASRSLMALLRKLARAHGRTIVIVLHDINYASAYADHIVTLKDGRLGPMGSPDQVIDSALLDSVFDTDATVHRVDGLPLVQV